ncbi:S8 family peptidase [Vallitalea okinawensis]|uniref:S8 family peptidase n=1 Tax=Vallitalea okinawensis TaxID=2078660 RepID=UPI00147840DE|nr:S8 family peptidase [Vallitalea okinawensis]
MKRQDNQLFETNCQEIITSEEYIDVVREVTDEEIEANIDNPEYACVHQLNDQYGVFYVSREGLTCDEAYRMTPYQEVPNLYGLYGKRAVAAAGIAEVQNLPALQLTGLDVLIGVVDTGIDYTHEAFIYEDDTTKIVRLWDQTGVGNPPEGFKFGTEYDDTQINEALLADDPFSLVAEMDDIGHGTFIAGAAAGRENNSENFIGAAPDADLVIVKLKPAKECIKEFYLVNKDAIAYQSHDVVLGVNYCLDMARELNRPIVILLGCGDNMGPHNGQTITEMVLAEVGMNSGVIVTVPAGNEANLYHHYRGIFREDEESQDVQFNVPEGEEGFYLSFWNNIPDKYTVGLISPRGTATGQIPFKTDQKQEITFIEERTEILIEYAFVEKRTGDQAIFIRLKYPSPGIWTLIVYGDIVLNGIYDIYLPREGFVDPLTRFLQPDPYTTVTSPATNPATITVGAYNDITSSLYLSSGRGLTRGLAIKPDLVAPGVNVIGPYPRGEYGSMTGTGVSTAITAGACALLLQWGVIQNNLPSMDTVIAKTFLIRGAYRRPAIEYPNREWGYGELDLINTFRIIET